MVNMLGAEVETLEVLFVADGPDLAEMYRLKLELDGYWVRIVSLDTAVAAARARPPDMVFLELPPGRTDRLVILRDIREAVHRPELPAIVLAGSTSKDLKRQGALLSLADYVVRTATVR
jgi:two-component system, OmpR family, phosphate regulon response regulator PhoB